jgi:hypothetical protein
VAEHKNSHSEALQANLRLACAARLLEGLEGTQPENI